MDRILIADDDAGIRGMLRDFLEDEGFDVDETDDSENVVQAHQSRTSAYARD